MAEEFSMSVSFKLSSKKQQNELESLLEHLDALSNIVLRGVF